MSGKGAVLARHSHPAHALTRNCSLKRAGEQLDDRIVEVHWDPVNEHWRMMRFRDDKPAGNYKTVVEKIIKSIADGVEKEQVIYGVFSNAST